MSTRSTIDRAASALADADAAVADGFSDHRRSTPVEWLSIASDIGDQPQLRLISGVLLAAGLVSGNRRLARAGARMLVAHEITTIAKNFVKTRVDRTRPRSAETHRQAKARPGRRTGKEVTSFPSGHTAGSLAVASAFAREYPEYRAPALAAAGFVAIAQIPRCAHYPTDIAAGALIGWAAEGLVALAWPAEAQSEAATPEAPPRPPPPRA